MDESLLADRIEKLERELARIESREIKARKIVLVDDTGATRVSIEMGPTGPELHLFDEHGLSRLKLALSNDGPGITLADEREHTRAWLGFAKDSLRIGFADEQGNSRAFFGVMPESGPIVRFYDASQNLVWSAPPSDNGKTGDR